MKNQRINKYGGPGPRQDRRTQRREEAAIRNEAWEALTTAGKRAALDARLGERVGAKKQRARLATKGW